MRRLNAAAVRALGWLALGVLIGGVTVALVGRKRESSLTEQKTYLEPLPRLERAASSAPVESRESRLATMALADQNAALRQEIGGLEEQVRQLTASLASVRAEADVFRAQLERAELAMESPGTGVLLREAFQVTDVDERLRMVILDAGSLQGVKPGMRFQVLRGDKPVAEVRAVDVRSRVSGAAVEETWAGQVPQKGDRAIPRRRTSG